MNAKSETRIKCPFCQVGTMREDSCGCLTCWKCHRVEGTNCNITACQGARFFSQKAGESHNVSNQSADCGCLPSECKENKSPKECPNCTWNECCCWETIQNRV